MNNKKILIIPVIIILTVFIGLNTHRQNKPANNQSVVQSPPPTQNDSPRIVSTKPDPLEEAIVSADQTIEITFNRSLENKGEFKLKIEPKIEFKIELSPDRKTAKIMPVMPFDLGTTYTIFIGTDTKFDGVGAWGQEKIFHFKTIKYTGV